MSASGFVMVFALVFAIGAPLLLWALISGETDDTDVMDRRSAEASARADTRTAAEDRTDDRRESAGWSNDDRRER